MSAGELWRSITISAVIAIAFGVIGYNIITNALEMVGLFGADLGADAHARLIYAQSHQWVHLFAAACGLALGWFFSRRNWWLFTAGLVAIVLCGSYGVQNMYGFAVKNRVGVAAVKVEDKAAAQKQYENARQDLKDQIRWLQATVEEAVGRGEKRRLEAQVDEKRKELSALRPPVSTADTVMADTSASGLGALTRTDPAFWLYFLPLALAGLMFMGESISFIVVGVMVSTIVAMIATYLAAHKHEKAGRGEPSAEPSKEDGSGGGSSGAGEPTRLRVVHSAEPEQAVVNAAPVEPSADPSRVVHADPSCLLKDPNWMSLVEAMGAPRVDPSADPPTDPYSSQVLVPAAEVSMVQRDPWRPENDNKVSTGGKRVKASSGPKRKRKRRVPFDEMRRAVVASLANGDDDTPAKSSHEIAATTGWSQTHVSRQFARERERLRYRFDRSHQLMKRDPRRHGASLHLH